MIDLKPWSDMTPRERDDLIARHLFGYATLLAEDSVFGPTLWLHDVEAVCDGKGGASNCRLLGGRCERLRVDGEIREVFVRLCPAFTARMDDGALIVEQEIKRRRLQDEYANALAALKPDSDWIMGEGGGWLRQPQSNAATRRFGRWG